MIAAPLLAANAVVLGILLGAGWMLPDLLPESVRLGVRVPPSRRDDPIVLGAVRVYRRGLLLATAVGGTVLAVGSVAGSELEVVAAPFLTVAGVTIAYVAARGRLLAAKRSAGWLAQGPVTGLAALDVPVPLVPLAAWWLPSALIWAATVVAGVLLYPSLPSVLPTHFSASGSPDAWSPKSPASVFGLTVVGAGVLGLFAGLAVAIARSKPYLEPIDPALDARRQAIFRSRMARGLLGLGAAVQATFAVGAGMVWGFGPSGEVGPLLLLAPVLVGAVVLVGVAVASGQLGSRLSPARPLPPGPLPGPPIAPIPDDDEFWRAGLVYVNPDDPALLVPRRFGVVWTLNLGNPWSWLVVALLAALVLAGILGASHRL